MWRGIGHIKSPAVAKTDRAIKTWVVAGVFVIGLFMFLPVLLLGFGRLRLA